MRRLLSIALGCAMFSAAAHAQSGEVPSQSEWISSKKTVQINDAVKMAYVEWGDPAGDPVVLVHGYSDNSRAFSTIAPFLKKGKRYIAVDLRGHGNSSAPACCFYVSDFAEDVSDFITKMGLRNVTVIGHSMGSMTAGVLASMHPEQVSKLVLISSGLKTGPVLDTVYAELADAKFPLDPRGKFMQNWAPQPGKHDGGMVRALGLEEAAVPKRVWLGVAKGFGIIDWTHASRRLTAKTLILWGDKDDVMSEAMQSNLRTALPQAKFIRYSAYGHSMFWEDPEMVARDINAFIK